MSERLTIISADLHVGPPVETYREYVDPDVRDDFERYLDHRYSMWDTFVERHGDWFVAYEAPRAAAYRDSARMLADLEQDGIVAGVVFGDGGRNNEIPFQCATEVVSHELRHAGARAYNRWLADYCGSVPDGRLAGLAAVVSLADPDAVAAEVRRSHGDGLRGVSVPVAVDSTMAPYWSPEYDPIWATCAELELSVNVHSGGPSLTPYVDASQDAVDRAIATVQGGAGALTGRAPLIYLIMGGVLERHPTLRLALTEQGIVWLPRLLQQMDQVFESSSHEMLGGWQPGMALRDMLSMKPSEYWARQCFVGASNISIEGVEARHDVGVEKVMFGSDYPHHGGSTLPYLRATYGVAGVPTNEARLMLCENAAALYGFDLTALQRVAERVGPDASDVLRPGDAEDVLPGDRGYITGRVHIPGGGAVAPVA